MNSFLRLIARRPRGHVRRTRWVGLAVVIVVIMGLAPTAWVAEAGEDFCEGDPIIAINGKLFNITVSIPTSALANLNANNPIVHTIFTPTGATANVVGYTGVIPERVDLVATATTGGSAPPRRQVYLGPTQAFGFNASTTNAAPAANVAGLPGRFPNAYYQLTWGNGPTANLALAISAPATPTPYRVYFTATSDVGSVGGVIDSGTTLKYVVPVPK